MRAAKDRTTCGILQDSTVIHESACLLLENINLSASVPDLRECIVRHCSPTLAGLKCGSMFRVPSCSRSVSQQLSSISRELAVKGVDTEILRDDHRGKLIYIYRPESLDRCLSNHEARRLLYDLGYNEHDMIGRLKERFAVCQSCPPEIGLFLDYPPEDVRGYMENNGERCHCIGCWKVYGDVDESRARFRRYRKCREVYARRFSEGYSISRLTVKA